ncbi:MAG: VOC family protein [Planctomycetes bacterium]|nr:VOC family protein [Planctomycetota bacterium]
MSVKAIPAGYETITPYLVVDNAAAAIDFYKRAFGATEKLRLNGPNGCVGHAELKIGQSNVMLADESPQMGARSPKSIGGSPVGLLLYVEDVDAAYNQAIAAGAKVERPVQDMFYGDRSGCLVDPFGHKWSLSTHIEDVAPDELKRRMDKLFAEMCKEQKK